MKNTSIKFTHDRTLITYDEQENKWKFTLRGRDRSAESLLKAKEIIDKPVEKAKPFEKIPAWFFKYGDGPIKVDVTGVAESHGYGGEVSVWVNNKGTRSKERANGNIFPQNEKNDALVEEIIEKETRATELRSESYDLKAKLQKLVLPKDE